MSTSAADGDVSPGALSGPGPRPVLRSALRALAGLSLTLALTFVGLTAVTFTIGRVIPADPVLAKIGDRAPQDVYDRVYKEMGLDQPLYVQYVRYIGELSRGDLGDSIMTARPVREDIARFFPATIELATIATLLGIFVGVPIGVLAAVYQGRLADHFVTVYGAPSRDAGVPPHAVVGRR